MRDGEICARSFGGNHVLGQFGRQVGYRPCCTRATHAAIPPTHALGKNHPLRARRLSPWKHFGPLAPRRLAAFHYSESFSTLDETWDRKAASLLMFPPKPVSRSPSAVTDLHARAPAVNPAPPSPRWAVRLEFRVYGVKKRSPLRTRRYRPPDLSDGVTSSSSDAGIA